MKVAAGILCWNQHETGRIGLFDACHESVAAARPDVLVVADNGSTDDTTNDPRVTHRFPKLAGYPHGNTCGYGMNKLAATLLETGADILVMSNDDIVWQSDAFDRLRKLWAGVPGDVAIISGLVEPTFALPNTEPWNRIYGVADLDDEKLLFRKSVPGGAWTFHRRHYPNIFPVSVKPGIDDVPACHKLIGMQLGCAAVDLAAHAGIEQSTWGNASHQQFVVEPLEAVRAKWGV